MATNFDRWESDPFFSAAEDVQDSADRLESIYRRWIHSCEGEASDPSASEGESAGVLRRELQTALGTAKWQLDEFDRAVKSSYSGNGGDTGDRHQQFVVAIQNQISGIEKALSDSISEEGYNGLRWIQLDEREKDDLASFLCGSFGNNNDCLGPHSDYRTEEMVELRLDDAPLLKRRDCRNSRENDGACVVENGFKETVLINKESKFVIELAEQKVADSSDEWHSGSSVDRKNGYRKSLSVGDDLGSWKILIADDNARKETFGSQSKKSSSRLHMQHLINKLGLEAQLRWSKGFLRRWKDNLRCHSDDEQLKLLETSTCSDGNKRIRRGSEQSYGWVGAVQRKMLRSQYFIQYRRPLQITWVLIVMLCLVGLFTFIVT